MNEFEKLQQRVEQLERLLLFVQADRILLDRHQQFRDGRNIQVGKSTGTKIGTETTQKLGFFGETPVVQPSAISAPSGGATVDTQARASINAIITALQSLGLTA